jgi:hypothetical protein
MPSTANPEEKEIVDVPENDGNASIPEQVKRPNPWKMLMMMNIRVLQCLKYMHVIAYFTKNT